MLRAARVKGSVVEADAMREGSGSEVQAEEAGQEGVPESSSARFSIRPASRDREQVTASLMEKSTAVIAVKGEKQHPDRV